ncbi:MAG: cytidylate kinase family protein [Spirochaetaceae bacterium]|jgi:cytidylate kinase|nr:cytidylate kinase family protein [Spirochaetaceae bacterium]
MAIITISRELAALGDETAKELSKYLSYRFIDKYMLEELIKNYITGSTIEKYDERNPSFFASISEDRDNYLHYLKTAILDEAKDDNCVFIGRGAFAVLENAIGVIPIFLVSSIKTRIERVKSYFRCDEKRAKQIIEQSDEARSGFHRFFFEKEWKAAQNYHITLNTSVIHPSICAQIIKNFTLNNDGNTIQTNAGRSLKDMILAQKIIHHIKYEKHIDIHFLEASVSDGKAALYGIANSMLMINAVSSAALEVPGVTDVHSDIQIIQEYSIYPYKI